jgi:hypothetical protein
MQPCSTWICFQHTYHRTLDLPTYNGRGKLVLCLLKVEEEGLVVRGTRVVRGDGEMNQQRRWISDQACGMRLVFLRDRTQLQKDTES